MNIAILLGALLWGIWVTDYPGKVPRLDRGRGEFTSYSECMNDLDRQLTFMVDKGLVRRVSRYQVEFIAPFPNGITVLYECEEIVPKQPVIPPGLPPEPPVSIR